MWIFLIGLVIWGLGLFCALRQNKVSGFDVKEILEKYAGFIYEKWTRISPNWYRVEDYLYTGSVTTELQLLNPEKRRRELFEKHNKSKLSISLLIVFLVLFLGLTFSIVNSKTELDGTVIKRNSYGQGEKQVDLEATIDGKTNEYSFTIQEREYSEKEMLDIFEEEFALLEDTFLNGNEGLQDLSSPVDFVNSVHDGLISVNWRLTDYEVLDGEGNINEEALEEKLAKSGGTSFPIGITAVLTYRDVKREKTWECSIVPANVTTEEGLERAVSRAVKSKEKESVQEDSMALPEVVDGKDVVWNEKAYEFPFGLVVLGVVGVIAVFVGKDLEVRESAKGRRRQMEQDYPEFVSKLTLMISAGVSLFNAWSRMCEGYLKAVEKGGDKRFVYEEMVITMREIQSGESENVAFERFGNRCMVPVYKKFSSIITQSMKKGTAGLFESLDFEVRQSFELRKANALILGEEASTKLLLPMGIMLGIVLIIVIAPAFMSMSV